ncbi:MAG: RNA polymerase sigma factor, partial [Myxococcota bacterium]
MSPSNAGSQAHLRVVGTAPERPDPGVAEQARIDRAQAGDVRAWEQLYLAHYRDLLRFCSYASGSVATAEDLTQEAFARALAGLASYDRRASFSTWLRGIAMNLLRKHWRKGERRARAYAKFDAGERNGSLPDDVLVRDRRAEALDAALKSLPAPLREAFILTDIQGLSAAESAGVAGTSPGNIRVRATRARARLHDALRKAG